MDTNRSSMKGLLRCRPEAELMDTEVPEIIENHRGASVQKPAKELRIVIDKIDIKNLPERAVLGSKLKTDTLKELCQKVERPKRSMRSTFKKIKYKDFVGESDDDGDSDDNGEIDSQIENLLDASSNGSQSDSPGKRKRKNRRFRESRTNIFSDCSDFDETYNPDKDETLRSSKSVRFTHNLANNSSRSRLSRNSSLTSTDRERRKDLAKSKMKTTNSPRIEMKIECEEESVNISDNCINDLNNTCKVESKEDVQDIVNDREEGIRKRNSRNLVFEDDTASSVSSDNEGEEIDLMEMKKISRKVWHKDYGYIISRTLPNGHMYLRCHRSKCKGTAYIKNGRIYAGQQKHDHSRRQDIEVRECDKFRAELYKLAHEKISTSTREIYDLVGAKYPIAAEKLLYPQMNNLMRRWRRTVESKDNIDSLSHLSEVIQRSNIDSSGDLFFSGKVTSSNGHSAIILGFKRMIEESYSLSKLMYIDVNLRGNGGVSYIGQIVTLFCTSQGKVLPMCYLLMENNSQELYESVFEHVKCILAPSITPWFIICDYEENLRYVLAKVYDRSQLHGHFFHYAQRIYRKATELNLITINEGEIANNMDNESKEIINDNDKIIMQYYSLALLPEKCVKDGLDHLLAFQPESFIELSNYFKDQWINVVGIKHFAIYRQIARTNDTLDVYFRKINDLMKNCLGSLKIYDALEKHHEFIRKQCNTLKQGERPNQTLSRQDKLFHPFLKLAWDEFDARRMSIPHFLHYCSEFLGELHHIFKYWHMENVSESKLADTHDLAFVPQENILVNEIQSPKPKESPTSVRPYAKISPNREIRYRNANVYRHDGYAYNRQNIRKKNGIVVKYMACRVSNCNGTLILKNDVATPGKNGHNHPREAVHNSEIIMQFKKQLRMLVKEHRTMATTEIYKIAAGRNPQGAKIYSLRLATQAMGRWKRELRSTVIASQPDTLNSVHTLLLSEEGKQLFSVDSYGVNYYSGTVKTTTGQCAVIFGDTQYIADNFKNSQNWIIDSNYRGASRSPFIHHVLIIFSLSREHVLPIAYILLEDRSEDLYTAVFSHIKKNLAPGIYPSFIMCDYDEIIHNAIKDIYNEATLQGSLFHYAQAIYRKAYSLNLITEDVAVRRSVLQYYALALLPADLIESGLEYLYRNQPDIKGFSELYTYVKTQWLERVGTAHMSTFMQCYRTSNVLELFQRVFNDKLSTAHPPIFDLLELIQKIHNISKSDCELLRKGKRQYVDRIGQRFDRLIDFKVNSIWKKLTNRIISVEGFLNTSVSYLESLHYVYNSWDLHDDKMDIIAPLMIEDTFILQSDEMIRATVAFLGSDDTQNTSFEMTTEDFDQKPIADTIDVPNHSKSVVTSDANVHDKTNASKKLKPTGRIMGKRGLNAVWQDGYCYYGNKICLKTESMPEKRYLQCRVKGCRGTAIIINGEFQLGKMEHNHKRDFNKEQIEEFKKTIKEMVFSQPLTNREIYDLAAAMNPAAAALVSFHSLESRLRRWRNARYIPIIPTKLNDMHRILTDAQGVNLVHTRNGSLYSGTVTIAKGSCAVILSEDHFVKQLMSCRNMFVERNYRCASRDVYVHCVVALLFNLGFQVVPVAYILMEDDSEDLYYAAIKYFQDNLVPNFNPVFIMCDYDEKLHNALSRVYNDANIQGCFFHYAQAIYRKAESLGLTEATEDDPICKVLKQYYALSLLPADSMASGLQYLNKIQPKCFIELWNYVKTEWFDVVGSEHLSVYMQPYRCNDTPEQFHKRHNSILEDAHPDIIHLIVHLKKTHDITIAEYGTRLKQRPAQTIRKAKQLFHSNLHLLWKRHINQSTPINNFFIASEEFMSDIHYLFNTWDKEEHVAAIQIPYLRNCAFVLNPDSVLNLSKPYKKIEKTNRNQNDATDSEQSDGEIDDQNAASYKRERSAAVRYSEILWKDGYGFHVVKKSRENAAGHLVTYIRCKILSCRVRGSIVDDRWNLTTELHNHSKDVYAEEDSGFRLALRHMIRDQPLDIDEIYNLVASLYPESAERTPLKKIRPMMIRWKKKFISLVSSSMAGSLIDMHQLLIGDSGRQLVQIANRSIYSGHVKTTSGHCALVFAEHHFIQEAFMASTSLFIDTNYRCTPRDPFVHHILIFFSIYKDNVLPFAYILMGSNSDDLYLAVLKYMKNTLLPNLNPEYIMCDFDIALHKSIRQVYTTANIHGCFFHYAQAIYRKALSFDIIDSVKSGNEHYSTLMQYYSLPLLPKDDIEFALEHLLQTQQPEFKKLWIYVKKQWLGRVGAAHLSMFGQPYRVNASFEVFSRKLNDMAKQAHPNMYDLIAQLLKLQKLVRTDYDQLQRGRQAQRVGRTMNRHFHTDIRRAWRRLGDGRISFTNFMNMAVEYMTNIHFVYSTWDVSSKGGGEENENEPLLPYMLDVPFVAHWCVDNVTRSKRSTNSKRRDCKTKSIEEQEYASGADNCDDFDNNGDDSSNEIEDPVPKYEPNQSEERVIVEQHEQIIDPGSTIVLPATDINSKLCFLCDAQKRTYACIPCGHLSYCVNCFPVVSRRVEMDKKCPVCQAQYMLVLEIHF